MEYVDHVDHMAESPKNQSRMSITTKVKRKGKKGYTLDQRKQSEAYSNNTHASMFKAE